ncbi:S-adenosylmethionine decarboxylase [Leptospira sp. GIMC2001]|uniref:S-adenosylmethionine decarboxylase n=1 Tax=Leptospira sp. GIMC2001 TaxID=1513297 RepID=UPI00234A74AD|nr:S-adenosylmethionine decarboxylase [Leptospira sp. GIMC2001]WCL47756.1 S-adenosylmethionine decarboxylase [Leptospira sp. GIMC2001]
MKLFNKDKLVSRFSYLHRSLETVENEAGQSIVVTNAPISKGETVAVWGGKVVHKNELFNLGTHAYAHPIAKDLYLVTPIHDDGPDTINLIRTSGNPNCGFKGEITLVALKDILAGEEISYDSYMLNPEVLQENDSFFEALRKRYNGHFSSFIQDEIQKDPNLRIFPAFQEGAWGLLTSIDLEGCNPETIRDADAIRRYVVELCELIDMKRFGDTHVVHFGEDERVAGYSMFQLIETSCISAHFANDTNVSYIDIFSCKGYDPKVAGEFTKKFFGGGTIRLNVVNRF